MPSKLNKTNRGNSDQAGPLVGGRSNLRQAGDVRVRETVAPVWADGTGGEGALGRFDYRNRPVITEPLPTDTVSKAASDKFFVEADPYGRDSGAIRDYRSPVEPASKYATPDEYVPRDYRKPNTPGTPDRDFPTDFPAVQEFVPVVTPYPPYPDGSLADPLKPFTPKPFEPKRKPFKK